MIGCPPTAAAKHEAGKGAVLQISSIPLPAGATGCSMIVAEARTAASAAGVAAAAAAAAAPAAGAAATIAEAVAMEEPASPQSTSSWALVEPWSSLLLAGGSLGEEGGDDAQDRKLAEVRLGDWEQDRTILQDAARTRSDTPAFRDANVRQWLERSVSLFCRERGLHYTQGMTELAAPWALITEPPCLSGFSYRCFCSFVDRFAPNIFATAPDAGAAATPQEGEGRERGMFVVLEAHLVLLEQLLRFHDPALAVYLDKCCAGPAAYATPWFVTLFARQMPVPAVLHLWRRLAEHGEPVLVQFLALALLVRSRRVLLDAPREDVLEAVTRLRLATVEGVEGLFGEALALRESTPRLFCDLLRRACYSDGGRIAERTAAPDHAAADVSPGRQENERGESGSVDATIATVAKFRACLLGSLRATGVLTVDADQVAEILLAKPSAPGAAAAAPVHKEDRRHTDAAARVHGRFVLVDCRPPQVLERGGDGRGSGGAFSGGVCSVGEKVGACGRHVTWRRIDPTDSFAKQVGAVSELLRECCGGRERREGKRPPVSPVKAIGFDAESSSCRNGVFEEVSVQHGAAGVASGSNVVSAQREGASNGVAANDATLSSSGGDTATHVCFIGMGGLDDSSGGPGPSFASPAEAAEARASAPEFRLSRVASLTCLTPHVCVLDGGFPALDQALCRRGFENRRRDASTAGVDDEEQPIADVGQPPFGAGHGSTELPKEEAAVAAAMGSGGTADEARGGPPRPAADGGDDYIATGVDKIAPGTPAGGSSPNLTSPAGGGGGDGDPVPLSAFSRGLERKASRLAGNRRISEPFRLYAAKSADEMALGLRSLPLSASKPLEDAARVCNSLAKTNVRALGDSRLSLSRSVARLEHLNARMDGTARGFATHFGASWHRGEVNGTTQTEKR